MRSILAASLLVFIASPALAQPHSHGTVNATEKLGSVHFATSCKPAAGTVFNRSMSLLHSFEFAAAIKGFESVIAADSTCAMAHWGIAMSRWGNPMAAGNRPTSQLQLGKTAAEAAVLLAPKSSEREQQYAAAVSKLYDNFQNTSQRDRVLAYEHAMADLVAKQPADTEAKIFYAIALDASASPTDKTYSNQRKAGAILEPLWVKQPNHPGLAHYIIHTYDYPALAPQAAKAAREYAVIAPSAAHALHMPSHIFTRTGQWRESIETNRKSIEAALKTQSIAEALHAADYAEYAYLQLGRYASAKSVVDTAAALAPRFDPTAVTGAAPGAAGVFALAAIPARYALERNAWAEAARLEPHPSAFPWTEAMTYFARALGSSHTGALNVTRESIDSLGAIHERLIARDETYWAEQVAIQQLEARAWLDFAEHRVDSALETMHEAVRREDATEKNAVTPGPLAPASELLADMLMEIHKPADALTEYQSTLKQEPNRRRALSGALHAAEAIPNEKAARTLRVTLKELH